MHIWRVPNPTAFGAVREWRGGIHFGVAPGLLVFIVIGGAVAVPIDEVESLSTDGAPADLPALPDFPARWLDRLPVVDGLRPVLEEDAEVLSLLVSDHFLASRVPAACREVARRASAPIAVAI